MSLNNESMLNLDSVPAGKFIRVNDILGDKKLARRLLALGITQGNEFEVINHRGHGLVLGRQGNRVALGQGVAANLQVEIIDQ